MVDEIVDKPPTAAIVTGRFQPSERLVEADVARELGVGRAAVRTALARLEHEGLIEHERHRGARVRLVEAREAVEILEISDHATAARLIATLKSQLVRFQYRTILLPGCSERSLEEHSAIVEAIAAGDPAGAEVAMRTHLSQVAEALRRQQP
jgi:DNA-binding GntR family transcriptional regulator